MRKFIIAIAAGASALAVATPAAAQYYQGNPGYGYNGYNGYNNGNGYGYGRANYGQVRSLQVRVNNLQRQIDRLAQRRAITRDEYNGLQRDARQLERRLIVNSRNGLSGREYAEVQNRIQWLERRISNEVRDGNRWGRNTGYNGYNDGRNWSDRDRDGRNDRYEDDRGRDHDGRRDRDDE
jgi:hypothetical protein